MSAPVYYREVSEAYRRLDGLHLPVTLAPWIAESTLRVLGLDGYLRYKLRPAGEWHTFEPWSRTVSFAGPTCSVLDVLHELAHWWEPLHNGHHLCAMGLLMGAFYDRSTG